MPDSKEQRVIKLMAGRGICSRREAERLIQAGEVSVDGVVVTEPGHKAPPDAVITVGASARARLDAKITVILHKPVNIVSTQPSPGQTPAWKLIRADTVRGDIEAEALARIVAKPEALSVAGRLDRASRGLLVLTEDGTVARHIIGGTGVKKSYHVRTAEPVEDAQIHKLRGEMMLQGQPLLPMQVERRSANRLQFVLVQGKKHQIRLVCRKVGLTVVDLLREKVGPFLLRDLPAGHWRLAARAELDALVTKSRRRT
jgi:23S rRNA pseudouridine2604 synthase